MVPAMVDPDGPLTDWHNRLFLLLAFLNDRELAGAGVTLDYSRSSLVALERVVLDQFAHPAQVAWATRRTFVEGLTAYLGETLMRRAGGAWAWREEPAAGGPRGGVPQVSADPALRLDLVSPLDLLREAVSVRDGERFTLTYDRWAHAVDDRMRVVPGWRPLKQPTAADPPGDPESAPLTAWLTRRAAAHLDWAAAYAPERSWAFTPDSLSALEALVRRITPTAEELNDPANREFREGAAWYLGETARRAFAGQWNLNLRRSGERNFPYVEKLGSRGARLTPVIVLEAALKEPGHLAHRWQLISGRPLAD